MTVSSVFITSGYVITICYSHHALISELIQSKSALNPNVSELRKNHCFKAMKISTEQRWFRADSLWKSAEFFMLSKSALEDVKALKQHCSELTTSKISIREFLPFVTGRQKLYCQQIANHILSWFFAISKNELLLFNVLWLSLLFYCHWCGWHRSNS